MPESLTGASGPEAWQSRTSWGVEIGPLRLAVTRTQEQRPLVVAPPATLRRGSFAAGALAGLGSVALLVVGASAAPQPGASVRYLVSVPVPAAAPRSVIRPARQPAAGRTPARAAAPLAAATGKAFDVDDEPHVARAMATGALQEWEDADGQRRFLTAGPARVAGGRACRDLALLVRLAEGGSRVRSAERCVTASPSDAPPSASDGSLTGEPSAPAETLP